MRTILALLSVLCLGASRSAGFLWNNNNKPFWFNPTTSKLAPQIFTTPTTTTTEAPTTTSRRRRFFFGSSSSSGSGSNSGSGGTTLTSSTSFNPFSLGSSGLFGFFDDLFSHDICPMIQGLPPSTNVREFKRECYFTGSRCGRCGQGEMCCATNVDGECAKACVKGVSEKRKAGTCPADMTSEPTGGIGWLHEFCRWAKATEAITTSSSCRVDGDCEGTSKCCQALPTSTDIIGACERKCVAPAGLTTESTKDAATSTTPTKTTAASTTAPTTTMAAENNVN